MYQYAHIMLKYYETVQNHPLKITMTHVAQKEYHTRVSTYMHAYLLLLIKKTHKKILYTISAKVKWLDIHNVHLR